MPSSNPTISKLAKTRDELIEAQEALAALPDRPLPHNEAIERAAALVDSQAAAFQGRYKAQMFAQLGTDLAQRDLLNLTAINQGALQNKVEAGPMLAWLLGDQIKQRMVDEISALALPDALPAAEREPERQRLIAKISDLEVKEERLARLLEDEGIEIDRRVEAPISLILALDAELAEHPPLEAA